ncbi:Hypothetical predicted protein [Lecanosticta acicola]|uniref:Uncharacterized protein n=1 Tax=Lecanosticta acicola TaxID=111012 RepID=A0AAI8Z3M7_9PEZI|nr:Hypothetical predicted protein [Lecanosticta acicola]
MASRWTTSIIAMACFVALPQSTNAAYHVLLKGDEIPDGSLQKRMNGITGDECYGTIVKSIQHSRAQYEEYKARAGEFVHLSVPSQPAKPPIAT